MTMMTNDEDDDDGFHRPVRRLVLAKVSAPQ